MVQNEDCRDLVMLDVVRVDIMPVTAIKVSIPWNVYDIASAGVVMSDNTALSDSELYADSLLSVNVLGDSTADAEMKEGVSLRVAEKRELSGMVRTHSLQIPIEAGFQTVRQQAGALQHSDFHVILTTGEGVRYLAYGLPNTCQFTLDDQMGQGMQMTAKVVLQSMSGLIQITES